MYLQPLDEVNMPDRRWAPEPHSQSVPVWASCGGGSWVPKVESWVQGVGGQTVASGSS